MSFLWPSSVEFGSWEEVVVEILLLQEGRVHNLHISLRYI